VTWLVSGGQVVWESAYTFRVSAAAYYINAIAYTSPEAVVTLGAADATLDRIDVIALSTLGTVGAIAGTASATPSEPSVDPALYLKLAIVSVPHATVAPPDVATVLIYAEAVGPPTEWTWTSSGASIVVNASTTPHVGTTCIDGTNVVAGVYAQGTAVAPFDPTDYDQLVCFLLSKAAWNNSRGLLVTLRLAGVLVGAAVQIRRTGTYGFDATVLGAYQLVAIPLIAFAVPQGATIDQVRFEDFGGAIGFCLDDISLHVGGSTASGTGGLSEAQADARYAPLVHAPRHHAGGADPLAVTALAGFPGGTTGFLRADASFAAPSAGLPLAHASTHNTGGTDPITALAASVLTTGTIDPARLPAAATLPGTIGCTFDGGGVALTSGKVRYVLVPYAHTITGAYLMADVSGTATVDVWRDVFASYPPVVGDSITAGTPPTLAGTISSVNTTLTSWLISGTANTVYAFSLTAVGTVTVLQAQLTVVRT